MYVWHKKEELIEKYENSAQIDTNSFRFEDVKPHFRVQCYEKSINYVIKMTLCILVCIDREYKKVLVSYQLTQMFGNFDHKIGRNNRD